MHTVVEYHAEDMKLSIDANKQLNYIHFLSCRKTFTLLPVW